jgi:hypothetical protein
VVQLREETITATAGSVVRIPPGVPDGLHNQETASARAFGAQLGIELISERRRPACQALLGKTEKLSPAMNAGNLCRNE